MVGAATEVVPGESVVVETAVVVGVSVVVETTVAVETSDVLVGVGVSEAPPQAEANRSKQTTSPTFFMPEVCHNSMQVSHTGGNYMFLFMNRRQLVGVPPVGYCYV